MSESSKDRFEKTFSRKKKESSSSNMKSNNVDDKSNKKSLKIHIKSPPPPSSSSKQKQPQQKTASKPSKNPPKSQQSSKQKPKKNSQPSDPAKLKKKPESAKRKVESESVGEGKEEVKKTKTGKKENKGKEKEKDEEEGLECVFPTARISRIVKSEGSDYRLSGEAVYLINKATEKFIGLFSEDAYGFAVDDHKSFVGYKHLSSSVSKGKRFDFLSDFVPEKVAAEKALAERKSSEAQVVSDQVAAYTPGN